MGLHYYRVVSVPPGCTEYEVDMEVELNVDEPPPNPHFEGEGDCANTEFELIEAKRAES